MTKWQRYKSLNGLPLGKDGKRITASSEHINLSREAAGEGMVLLKNNGLLPLKKGQTVALFGKASVNYVKGGGGSGDVGCPYVRNLLDGMRIKKSENKIAVYDPVADFYNKALAENNNLEPTVPADLIAKAANDCDAAIVSISRYSWEEADKTALDFYLTAEEKALVESVSFAFTHTVVVLNVGSMVDTAWFKDNAKIDAVLLGWQAGMEGGLAEADILVGDVNPSGKIVDTFASSFDDYPSSYNFHESDDYCEYTDDIYVGYRYFETIPNASEKVNYPFGFGLSYTSFDITPAQSFESNGVITVKVRVTNSGNCAGKEVVQVYYTAPQGKLGKPKYQLCGFAKTALLQPGETRIVTVSFNVNDMASFDDKGLVKKSCYVLENGAYDVSVGNCVSNVEKVFTYTVFEDTAVSEYTSLCKPHKLSKRLLSDGNYEYLTVDEYPATEKFDDTDWNEFPEWAFKHIQPDKRGTKLPDGVISLESVVDGTRTLDEFMQSLTVPDLIDLCGGRPNIGLSNTMCWGDLPANGVPSFATADGPAGLRIDQWTGVRTTAFPCATLLACTWNTDIVEQVGNAASLELKENNFAIWLAPAMNIHRSPLCGRNFEYYSEDPFVAGKIAAAMVKGVQSNHIAACIKHFCCNNKETNRKNSDSIVSERALREIYLKAFEICIKDANPWSLMSSYNKLNGVYTAESHDLLTGILRDEWGYKGVVTSDWQNFSEHYLEIKAGNDIKMPVGSCGRLLDAYNAGLITRAEIEKSARRVIELILKFD